MKEVLEELKKEGLFFDQSTKLKGESDDKKDDA